MVSRLPVPESLSWLDLEPATGLVFAISETRSEVFRLRLAPDLASVTVMETLKLPGTGPAHLLVDRAGGYAYSANYGSGTWTQLRLGKAGQLEGVARHETFPGEGGNCSSHPHQTLARGRWLWVTDLGCDAIYTLASDSGAPGSWSHLGRPGRGSGAGAPLRSAQAAGLGTWPSTPPRTSRCSSVNRRVWWCCTGKQ